MSSQADQLPACVRWPSQVSHAYVVLLHGAMFTRCAFKRTSLGGAALALEAMPHPSCAVCTTVLEKAPEPAGHQQYVEDGRKRRTKGRSSGRPGPKTRCARCCHRYCGTAGTCALLSHAFYRCMSSRGSGGRGGGGGAASSPRRHAAGFAPPASPAARPVVPAGKLLIPLAVCAAVAFGGDPAGSAASRAAGLLPGVEAEEAGCAQSPVPAASLLALPDAPLPLQATLLEAYEL